MVQLNDKFVDSCEIAEDNSLSYIVKSQINENQEWNISNNNNNKKGNEVIPNYKLQSINNKNNNKADKNLENKKNKIN